MVAPIVRAGSSPFVVVIPALRSANSTPATVAAVAGPTNATPARASAASNVVTSMAILLFLFLRNSYLRDLNY